MRPILIVGNGGFSKEVAWLAEECQREVHGFLVEDPQRTNEYSYQYLQEHFSEFDLVIGVGSPKLKNKIRSELERITRNRAMFATLIHPSVCMSNSNDIGEGCLICAGSVLTTGIKIGSFVTINLSCTIGHDCLLEDYVTVAPNASISGNVIINEGVEIGTGALVRQGLILNKGSTLGMGAVLTKDMPVDSVYVGNPAKPLVINS